MRVGARWRARLMEAARHASARPSAPWASGPPAAAAGAGGTTTTHLTTIGFAAALPSFARRPLSSSSVGGGAGPSSALGRARAHVARALSARAAAAAAGGGPSGLASASLSASATGLSTPLSSSSSSTLGWLRRQQHHHHLRRRTALAADGSGEAAAEAAAPAPAAGASRAADAAEDNGSFLGSEVLRLHQSFASRVASANGAHYGQGGSSSSASSSPAAAAAAHNGAMSPSSPPPPPRLPRPGPTLGRPATVMALQVSSTGTIISGAGGAARFSTTPASVAGHGGFGGGMGGVGGGGMRPPPPHQPPPAAPPPPPPSSPPAPAPVAATPAAAPAAAPPAAAPAAPGSATKRTPTRGRPRKTSSSSRSSSLAPMADESAAPKPRRTRSPSARTSATASAAASAASAAAPAPPPPAPASAGAAGAASTPSPVPRPASPTPPPGGQAWRALPHEVQRSVLLKGLANGSVHASNGVSSGAAPWEASSSAAAAPAQGWYGGAPPAPQQQSQQQQQHPVIPVIATPLHLVAQHQPLPPSSSSPFDSGGDNDAAAAAAGAPASPSSMPRLSHIPDDICVVDTPQKARQVAAMMLDVAERGVYSPSATSSGPRRDPVPVHFAVDTEVAGIDIKEESPVGHGAVVCLSVYAGPWANFNPDAAGPRQPRVWIDLLPGYGPRVVAAERAASEASEVAVQLEQASTLAAARAAEAIKHARAMRAAEASGTKKPRARRRSRSSTSSKAAAASSGGSVDALGADDQLQHQHQQQQPAEAEFLPSTTPEAVALADNLAEEAERAAEQARAARERADAAAALFPPPAPTVAEILGDSQASAILEAFRPFLEADTVEQARAMMVSCGGGRGGGGGAASPSPSATATKLRKIWHNYGFDRHVLGNMGVACGGFAGDTLHLARLHDASRRFNGGFSLEALSSDRGLAALLRADLLRAAGLPPHAASPSASSPSPTDSPQPHQSGLPFDEDDVSLPKRGMRERFGESRVKRDGGLAKAAVVQPMHLLHALPRFRAEWVDYSALDAKATWNVHRALRAALLGREAHMDGHLRELLRVDHVAWQDSVDRAAPPVGVSASAEASAAAMALAAHDPAALSAPRGRYTMWHFYEQYWLPFGRLLTDMEAAGVRVDRAHLAAGEQRAREDQRRAEAVFRAWASRLVPGAAHMNISSGLQVRQLLFPDAVDGGVRSFRAPNPEYDAWKEEKDREKAAGGAGGGAAGRRKTAKLAADGGAADSPSPDLVDGKPARPKRWLDFDLHGVWGRGEPGRLAVETKTDKGAPAVSTAVLRALAGKPGAARRALTELDAKEAAGGEPSSAALLMLPEPLDVSGADGGAGGEGEGGDGEEGDGGGSDGLVSGESGDDGSSFSVQLVAAGGASGKRKKGSAAAEAEAEAARLEALQREGEAMGLGTMYAAMGGGREGVEACCALEALCDVSAVDKLLSAFLVPLQGDSISTPHDHRVHCSLNLNTETGRLSARRPNLQNQPALEKDRYQVRRAFAADVSRGRTLVVADYGQLELRLLAHMTGCKSMIEAFELGGDFHSRTALGMYDHIRAAVDRGDCLLEWEAPHDHDDPSAPQPKPPAPLLKDVFASERRKAKVLNFSIAYGKTARGLSRDWGVPLSEAEETLERWYGDRPEVRGWQERQRAHAREHGYVNTLLGRRRGLLPAIASPDRFLRLRAERAAINTPIQGSAADVAAAAMLAIDADAWLREHGWRLLLQVHDEVMLEGPKETAEEARRRVVAAMANPWAALCGADAGVRPLLVELAVDCKSADTWYEAK